MKAYCMLAIVLTLAGLTCRTGLQAQALKPPAYEAVYVFGHSWGDTKGASGSSYWRGRWANGPIWVELLSTNLNLTYQPSNNFARAEATSQEVLNQVTAFRPTAAPERGLYCLTSWALADFVFNAPNVTNDTMWADSIRNWVGLATNVVLRLYAKGARSVLVQNCVDPNRMPTLVSGVGTNLSKREKLSERVSSFNAVLRRELASIGESRADLRLFVIDLQAGLDTLVSRSSQVGFTHQKPDALADAILADKSFTGPGADYLFWDSLHPTAKTHTFVAQWTFDELVMPLERLVLRLLDGQPHLFLRRLQIDRAYSIQTSADLLSWQDLGTLTAASGTNELRLSEPRTQAAFFRLRW